MAAPAGLGDPGREDQRIGVSDPEDAVQAGQINAMGLIDERTWDKGIADLYRTTRADGTFCYTFFKGVGIIRQ